MNHIQELSRRIAEEFQPDKIILFGSHAYGVPQEHFDVDLLVIMPFEGKGFRKGLEILNRLNPKVSLDVVVRRPDDAARRYKEFDPLIREAFDRGIVLHDRTAGSSPPKAERPPHG